MKNIIFECETVTPMFLAGYDGATPELRPPSIKGMMRFWWRALNGHLSLDELKKREGEIFGASDKLIGKSKFSIRISTQLKNSDIIESLWNEIPYESGKNRAGKSYKVPKKDFEGISYLLYSAHMLNERPYIKSGSLYSIKISSYDDKIYHEVIKSFALLTFFGGLGARNRRGAGSFWLPRVPVSNNEYKNIFETNKISSKEEMKNHIEFNFKPLLYNHSNSNYSILKNSKIYILNPTNNWKAALEILGRYFLNFRMKNDTRIVETPNFGFPILHRNRHLLMGAGKKDHKGNIIDFLERRASPLIFKIIKTNQNNFFPIIIWLNGELIPSDYLLMDKYGVNIKNPNDSIINEFLNGINGKLEVIL